MAEGGFELRQNFNFSDSDSEGEEDGLTRDVRERLFVFGIDGDVSSERKDSSEVGLQSSQIKENGEAETTSQGSSANNSSSSGQASSCPVLYDNVSNRRRSFTLGRLVRRFSRNRRRTVDDAYREIEIGAVDGTMLTAGLETAHNSSLTENQTSENLDTRRRRQRPQSTVVLRPRTTSNAVDRRTRRPNSFIGRVCKLFDSNNAAEDSRETPSGSILNTESSTTDSSTSNADPGTPTITFPIGVNELVAIRRERARLRVEQTRIEYHIIPDLLQISNCPWYWGKINRFEAERVLQGQSDGTFLLRDSAQHHYLFSVSFRRYFRTYHARIEQWKHYYSFDKPSDFSFRSRTLCDLLEHYSQAEQCMYYEPLLLHPFPRKSVLSLQHLCRANICNKTTFQGVEELPLPKSLKLYLREYHYKVAVKKMEDKGTQTVPPRKIFGICRN